MIARHHELIDCHIRLQHAAYEGQREGVLERAWRAGVAACVCSSQYERDWHFLLEQAATDVRFIPCFGIDPVGLAERPKDWYHKLQLCLNTGPAAVGMVGLDRSVRTVSLKDQEEALQMQLLLAGRMQCPVLLRCGGEWQRLVTLLEMLDEAPSGYLLSGYHGPVRLVERFVRTGAYFCFNGDTLVHKFSRAARLLKAVPLDRLLFATDSPAAIPPDPFAPYQLLDADRHPINEPANLPHLVEGVAPVLDLEPDELARMLQHNALCLFGTLMPAEA
ncbi:TatD family hydrolase [Planctomycetota bacterium]